MLLIAKRKKKCRLLVAIKRSPMYFVTAGARLLRKSHHLKLNNHDTQGSRSFISAFFGRDSFPSFCRASGFSFPCSSGAKERAAEKEKERGREREGDRKREIHRASRGGPDEPAKKRQRGPR